MYNITNNSVDNEHLDQFEHICSKFIPYAKKRLGFNKPINIEMVSDPENAKDPFGKTAYYDSNTMKITLFVDNRHIKDILRSLSHELVHHAQNCRGDFKADMHTGPGYAQKNPHLRKLEGEAYTMGNGFVFRDFEDQYKQLTEKLDHFLNLIEDETKTDVYLLRPIVTKEKTDMSTKIKILKETLDLQHEGKPCDIAHKGKTHEEYQQMQGIMTEDDPKEKAKKKAKEKAGEKKQTQHRKNPNPTDIPFGGRVDEEEGLEESEELEEKEELEEIDIGKLKKAAEKAGEVVKGAPKKKKEQTAGELAKKAAEKAAGAAKKAQAAGKKQQKEHWTKGNKDELLFERLVKKWAK